MHHPGWSSNTVRVFAVILAALVLTSCTIRATVQEHVKPMSGTQGTSTAPRVVTAVPSKTMEATIEPSGRPTASITVTLSALPPGPSIQRSHVLVDAFINAYNHHDSSSVLLLLDDQFQYADCDYARHIFQNFRSKLELAMWLRDRFAEQAHFDVEEIIIANPQGDPPGDPRNIGVGVIRTATTHQRPIKDGFKIILNKRGDRITGAALSSREVCHQT